MTSLKLNFSLFFFLFAFCLNAQDYPHSDYQWENSGSLDSPGVSVETFVNAPDLITSTETIYKALHQGNLSSIKPYLTGKIKWNDQEDYTFSWDTPSFAHLFDQLIPDCADWNLYDLTYQELPNNVIRVSGRYRLLYHDRATEAPFIQTWKWKSGRIVAFQNYEATRAIARR